MKNLLNEKPKGFCENDWIEFSKKGFLLKKGCIDPHLIKSLEKAIYEVFPSMHDIGKSLNERDFILKHPVFSQLIDYPAYIGQLHDVYGDSLTLLLSNLIIRAPDQAVHLRNTWHFDGPRITPFRYFSAKIPLRIKIGIALTDCALDNMGNLIVIPCSHRLDHIPEYLSHASRDDEIQVAMSAGDIIFMHEGLWHKVAENSSDSVRNPPYSLDRSPLTISV